MHPILKLFLAFLFLITYTVPSFALKEDSKEKLHIIADSSIYNYKSGFTVFEGNVKVDQGTTHITSDRLTTKTNKQHKIQEAIAYGVKEPAHYWTLQKINQPEMHARANIIKYYPIDSNVTLEQNVVVTQGENNFQGQLILYNMGDETITVPASKNGRAVLVYNPDK